MCFASKNMLGKKLADEKLLTAWRQLIDHDRTLFLLLSSSQCGEGG